MFKRHRFRIVFFSPASYCLFKTIARLLTKIRRRVTRHLIWTELLFNIYTWLYLFAFLQNSRITDVRIMPVYCVDVQLYVYNFIYAFNEFDNIFNDTDICSFHRYKIMNVSSKLLILWEFLYQTSLYFLLDASRPTERDVMYTLCIKAEGV